MQRDTQPQYDVVCPTGEIDLRGWAGGTITGGTASGTANVETKVNDSWVPLTVGGVQVTMEIAVGQAEVMPDAMYHAGLVRLSGISGTVHAEPKS